MGVIIKYQLEFPRPGLRVSNDLYGGEWNLDVEITARMEFGRAGSSFAVKLYDLPLAKARDLETVLREEQRAHVVVRLGYFDGAFEQVLDGIFTRIESAVEQGGDRLVTTIEGLEAGTYFLGQTEFQNNLPEEKPLDEQIRFVLSQAALPAFELDRQARLNNVSGSFRDKVFRGRNLLGVLDELAARASAELLIRDKKVWMGRPVVDDSYEPPAFDRDVNLAAFRPYARDVPAEADRNLLRPLKATMAHGFAFTVTGDPLLRPGHRALAAVEGFDALSGQEFRVQSLTHEFSTSAGYVCKGVATRVEDDENSHRRSGVAAPASAATVAETLTKRIQSEQRQQPAVEVAKVREYSPGSADGPDRHRGTLYFGQRFEREETQPSVRADVETDERQLFRNKPIASPFAWNRCGLVVPVYPGMKALVSHNLSLQDDAVVSGFLWSEEPAIAPPDNRAGDWWLCLPIDFDAARPPSDSTLAANDLTANNGRRVIEVKGLKITVGMDTLRNVGERPAEGEDDEFLIEHKSGTTVRIDREGNVTVEAQKISLKGDVSIEGKLDVSGDVSIQGNVEIV